MTGRIIKLPEGKNFGFLQCNGADYFFHRDDYFNSWNDLIKDFRNGKIVFVSFEQVESPKGLRAKSVRRD